jgi:ribosomal protein S18 acetylase RimI-like enzyme
MNDSDSETWINLKRNRVREFFSGVSERIRDLYNIRDDYVEMEMPASKMSPEFVQHLKDKVKSYHGEVAIREASKEDIDIIMDIYEKAWKSSTMPFRISSKEKLKDIYEYKGTKFLLASVDQEDVGFILIDIAGIGDNTGIIVALGILPEYQRKGIGHYLALHAWEYFQKHKVNQFRCEVHVENKVAINFIKEFGFIEKKKYVDPYGSLKV